MTVEDKPHRCDQFRAPRRSCPSLPTVFFFLEKKSTLVLKCLYLKNLNLKKRFSSKPKSKTATDVLLKCHLLRTCIESNIYRNTKYSDRLQVAVRLATTEAAMRHKLVVPASASKKISEYVSVRYQKYIKLPKTALFLQQPRVLNFILNVILVYIILSTARSYGQHLAVLATAVCISLWDE